MSIKEKLDFCLNCISKPCQKGCPQMNNIPDIIRLMKEEKYEEAYEELSKTNVLPAICGRICPHNRQCQGSCTRKFTGKSVEIGKIEEYLGKYAIKNGFELKKFDAYEKNKSKDLKVAVIGSGPAGLSCAAFLARSGINVTIYEKYKNLGGILSHGIPDFRINKYTLNTTINKIIDLGIDVKYNSELNKNIFLDDLLNEYNAVFLGIGANVPMKMNIEGEELSGVYGANELLENKKVSYKNKNIIVIGGGNVAIDMARTAKRKGAKKVTIVYRRSENEMPAELDEISDAKLDNVKFLFQTNVVRMIENDNIHGKVAKVECVKTDLIENKEDNRKVPIDIDGSNYQLDVDMVIEAIGSKVEGEIVDSLGIKTDKNGYIAIKENRETSIKNVFAAGDVAGDIKTVAMAARAGREAGESILKTII